MDVTTFFDQGSYRGGVLHDRLAKSISPKALLPFCFGPGFDA
jgi:hypothetical protein